MRLDVGGQLGPVDALGQLGLEVVAVDRLLNGLAEALLVLLLGLGQQVGVVLLSLPQQPGLLEPN